MQRGVSCSEPGLAELPGLRLSKVPLTMARGSIPAAQAQESGTLVDVTVAGSPYPHMSTPSHRSQHELRCLLQPDPTYSLSGAVTCCIRETRMCSTANSL